MKHPFKIVLGLALIIIGVIWVLNLAGVPGFAFCIPSFPAGLSPAAALFS